MEDTQKKLDKALKRNLINNQPPQATPVSQKSTTASELPAEEPINDGEEVEQVDE